MPTAASRRRAGPTFPTPAAAACAALLAFWLAPGAAAAQTLQQLYDASRAYDATYLSARALSDSAQYRVEQVEALNRPSAAATASIGPAVTDIPGLDRKSSVSASGAISARMPIFNRANAATIEQARRSLESARADLETAEQDLIVRLSQAYFDVLAAQDTLATNRASKAAITEQLASAKRNFEVGTATITDTREAQARYDLANAQEIAAENDLRTKRIALDTLVGRTGVEPRPLQLPAALAAPVPANPEEWVSAADQAHPTVRRARVALDVAQLETQKARAGNLPTVDAVASVSGVENRGPYYNTLRSAGGTTVGSVGLQLNWPLYTGGSVQNRIRETLVLEDKARQDLEAARRGVAQATRTAWFGVQSGMAQVQALEAAESSSKLALEATQLGYKVGVRVNLDVLNAQTQLYTTQTQLAKARYDVLMATLRLRQAAGQLAPGDLQAVNALLAP